MKYILLFVAFSFSFQLHAQENAEKPSTKIFVRLYDNNNYKIGKGNLLYGNDSTIQLSKGHTIKSFPVTEVEAIKTKHAAGHNFLIASSIGVSAFIATEIIASSIGNGNDNGSTSFDVALVGLPLPIAGLVAGGVAEALRKSETFIVNGSTAQWLAARKILLNLK